MLFFFFFKQKTAYEMLRSLVGSEMCIRDSLYSVQPAHRRCDDQPGDGDAEQREGVGDDAPGWSCLLYTSDAADDLLCVDLGGRRIIKQKK